LTARRIVEESFRQLATGAGYVPIPLATSKRKKIEPDGWMWNSVLACTGQPREMS
jgi:hypothetical protein